MVQYGLMGAAVWLLASFVACGLVGLNGRRARSMKPEPIPKPIRASRERLDELVAFATWHREQMEGELQELCEFFGTNTYEETLIRDWCVDVIYNGAPLQSVFDNIAAMDREEAEANQE